MNDDDGRKLSLFIALQQEGLSSDQAERRVLALLPFDAAFPPGAEFEAEAQQRSTAFADALRDPGADPDALAVDALEGLRQLAATLGEDYYAERFDRALAGVPHARSEESAASGQEAEQEWPTATCPVCGQVGTIHPDDESRFAYRPGHLAFWTRECRRCGEWFAVEKRDPTHVERVDPEVRSFVEDTIHELGMNRWPAATGGEPDEAQEPAARSRPPRKAERDSPAHRLRRSLSTPRGRIAGLVAGLAVVGGGIAAGLLLTSGDEPSAAPAKPNARVVLAAGRSWTAQEVVVVRDATKAVRRRVLVRVPAGATSVQIRVARPAGMPPPLLLTGAGKAAESRPLPNGRARVRLPGREAQRRVVVVLRAPKGDGEVAFTVRARTRGGA